MPGASAMFAAAAFVATASAQSYCVTDPTSGCECPAVIRACSEESYQCEVSIKEIQRLAPQLEKDLAVAKYSHPLLNTFVQTDMSGLSYEKAARIADQIGIADQSGKSRLRKQPLGAPPQQMLGAPDPQQLPGPGGEQKESAKCHDCFMSMAHGASWVGRGGASFLQEESGDAKFDPPERGWRLVSGDGSEGGAGAAVPEMMVGLCLASEAEAMNQCLSYYIACDQNREAMMQWYMNSQKELGWIVTHPLARPGIFQG